jgi:hypothetical protein
VGPFVRADHGPAQQTGVEGQAGRARSTIGEPTLAAWSQAAEADGTRLSSQ